MNNFIKFRNTKHKNPERFNDTEAE